MSHSTFMENDLISIIVPIYNVEKYLDRCIESLIRQTYKNIEIILVDDGSSDTSGKIALSWKKKDNRIIFIRKNNGGLSDARNYGIQQAKGKFLSFVDSDDYVDSKFIEVLYRLAIDSKTKLAAVGFKYVSDTGIYNQSITIVNNYEVFNKEEAMSYLFTNNKYCNYAWNKLYAKELFDGVVYPKGMKMEDLGTTYLLIEKCDSIAYNPTPLYFYCQRQDSILHKPDKKFFKDKYKLVLQRYIYVQQKYPHILNNYVIFFETVLETYPYLEPEDQRVALNEATLIWTKLKKYINFKNKLKYLLLVHWSRFYVKLLKKI